MNKVMTRTKRTTGAPGTRPPVRHDTRRPGGGTPRTTPGGGTPRTRRAGTTPGNSAPSGSAPGGTALAPTRGTSAPRTPLHTAPRDGRPPTTSTTSTTSPVPSGAPPRTTPTTRTVPAEGPPGAPRQPRPTDLFADRLLAVLSGQRPVHCMLRHTAGRAYDELAWLAERGPLRARGTRPVVRDIGYYVPRPGAVEAFARIGAGDQLRAMAFRLEQGPDLRWRCTAVELGGARMPHTNED
ncbi:Rv3235 family protein [Streptomyces sp. NPDC057199]|uniref:Rv3235 family protein n=1 Tax=Streptomyces sp. NPDC057199 TaxID=3346047 RepID=UPI00362EB21A